MKCQICNIREADIVIAMHAESDEKNICVCHQCVHDMGVNFHNMVSNSVIDKILEATMNTKVPACPSCGLSLDDYKKHPEKSCPKCQHFFGIPKQALPSFLNKRNEEKAKANVPSSQDLENKKRISTFFEIKSKKQNTLQTIILTKNLLNEAIKEEDFEQAAKLRDKLKKLSAK